MTGALDGFRQAPLKVSWKSRVIPAENFALFGHKFFQYFHIMNVQIIETDVWPTARGGGQRFLAFGKLDFFAHDAFRIPALIKVR